jgi:phage FluMu protein Com
LSEEVKNTLDIECPHCHEENQINLSKEIKCKKCEKPLIGEKYRKPIFSAMTTILIGSGLGLTADAYLNINRASVKTEYKMMKTCIDEFGNLSSVRDQCACAVESMLGMIDAKRARSLELDQLTNILKSRYYECK